MKISKLSMTKYYIGVAEIEVDSSRIRLDELKKGITIDRGAEIEFYRPVKNLRQGISIIDRCASEFHLQQNGKAYIREYFLIGETSRFDEVYNAEIVLYSQF